MFYATAAEALSTVQGEIEELSVAAEGEYRYVGNENHVLPVNSSSRSAGNLATTELLHPPMLSLLSLSSSTDILSTNSPVVAILSAIVPAEDEIRVL